MELSCKEKKNQHFLLSKKKKKKTGSLFKTLFVNRVSLVLLPLKVTILKHIHEDVTGAICTSIKRNIITRQVNVLQRMMAFTDKSLI